jgi:hypothetical protein
MVDAIFLRFDALHKVRDLVMPAAEISIFSSLWQVTQQPAGFQQKS